MHTCRRFAVIVTGIFLVAVSMSMADISGPADRRQPTIDRMSYNGTWGTSEIISGHLKDGARASRESTVRQFIEEYQPRFLLRDPAAELEKVYERSDALGMTHLRFRQMYNGLRVWGYETIAHFDAKDELYMIGGQTIPTPDISIVPGETKDGAISTALSMLDEKTVNGAKSKQAELLIYPRDGRVYLAWLVSVDSWNFHWRIFVDAKNGNIIHSYNEIYNDGPTTGTGPDVHGTMQSIQTYDLAGDYWMIDASRPMYAPPISGMAGVIASHLYTDSFYDIVVDENHNTIFNDQPEFAAAISAHVYVAQAYEYFLNTFGRNSYDDNGGSINTISYYPEEANNAFYLGEGVVGFGSGNGSSYLPWSGSLDIAAHEFSHGVTASTAGLIYEFQPGALNESYSDFFGCMVDRDDWTTAEEIALWSGGFLRSLENPHDGVNPNLFEFGYQPMHMDEYVFTDYAWDFGAVHYNSGIPNHAGYLVSEAISREKAEQIWYRTLTTYLTPNSSFYTWAQLTKQAAFDLYGDGAELDAVEWAMDSVGIGTLYLDPQLIVNFPVLLGETADTGVFVHNLSSNPVDILTAASVVGNVDIQTPVPLTINANDSIYFELSASATGATVCDLGSYPDTLFLTTTSVQTPTMKLPVTATVSMAMGGRDTTRMNTDCGFLETENTLKLVNFVMNRSGNSDIDNVLYRGTFMIGLLDGADTVVYQDYDDDSKQFPPVDTMSSSFVNSGMYIGRSVNLVSEDSRIQGKATYLYSRMHQLDTNNCLYVILDYRFYNLCDTALEYYAGLLCDFDVIDGYENLTNFDGANNMSFVYDLSDQVAAGIVCLRGTPTSYRSINNEAYIWPTQSFPAGEAYKALSNAESHDGLLSRDWSTLMNFGAGVLGPGDTAHYQVALVYSMEGVAGLYDIVDNIIPAGETGEMVIEPGTIEIYIPQDAPPGAEDTSIVVKCIDCDAAVWEATNGSPWLQLDKQNGFGNDTIGISFDFTGYSPGDYFDTIMVHSDDMPYKDRRVTFAAHLIPGDGAINVPEDFATISEAVENAVDGTTILVGPGVYSEQVTLDNKNVRIIATDGPEATVFNGTGVMPFGFYIANDVGPWSGVSGFTMTGFTDGTPILITDNVEPFFANNIITGNGSGAAYSANVYVGDNANIRLYNNVFYGNRNKYTCLWLNNSNTSSAEIIHNTFHDNNWNILTNSADVTIKYNIFTNSTIGFPTEVADHDFNDSWGNDTDFHVYNGSQPGPNDFSENPQYCYPPNGNFTLMEPSACAPANNPSGTFIGAFDVGCPYTCGDATGDLVINVGDAVFVINYVFKGGQAPNPLGGADANCDGVVNVGDAVYVINFVFKGGFAPCCP